MNKSLTRSIGFWILVVLSLASVGVGAWLITGQIGTMTTTLLDGTATGVEVYVGQSLVVVGAVVLGAGIIGILLSLGLVAARALVPAPAAVVVEPIDWSAEAETIESPATDVTAVNTENVSDTVDEATVPENQDQTDDQNGSSGSTATATKISVK